MGWGRGMRTLLRTYVVHVLCPCHTSVVICLFVELHSTCTCAGRSAHLHVTLGGLGAPIHAAQGPKYLRGGQGGQATVLYLRCYARGGGQWANA